MPRQIKLEDDCRQAILRGMDRVADLVGSTLGPRGHTVILGRPVGPALVTKDGVTVARNVSLPDAWENEGVKLIQEVAAKTNTEAGDGTTAATVLTRALYREGIRQITAGADSQALERGMKIGVDVAVKQLQKMATKINLADKHSLERLTDIATIAANSDEEMGSVIAKAVHHAGLEGNYTLDPSPTAETLFEVAAGLQFQRGLDKWPQFMNDPRGMTVFGACNIFVTDRHLIDGNEMTAFLQRYLASCGKVPLVIIAEDLAQGALQVLTVNNGKTLDVCPVRAPALGPEKKEFLEDIAILTGSNIYTVANGKVIANVEKDDFGSADRVLVTPHRTTIVGGAGTPLRVEARKEELRSRIADPEVAEYMRAGYEKRLASISAKIAVIKIGAGVNSKLLEKRDRAEDSLNATLGALKEGYVPGGGTALIRCLPYLDAIERGGDEKLGIQIVRQALTAPLRTLAANAGQGSGDVVVDKVLNDVKGRGYNAATGTYEDLCKAGVIDPVKVIRLALQNAVELAGLLLTSSGGVVDVPDPVQQAAVFAAQQASLRGSR